jgi:hypothetical protein
MVAPHLIVGPAVRGAKVDVLVAVSCMRNAIPMKPRAPPKAFGRLAGESASIVPL